jgi:hypothetical protein
MNELGEVSQRQSGWAAWVPILPEGRPVCLPFCARIQSRPARLASPRH